MCKLQNGSWNGLADLQSAEHCKPNGYFWVTKSLQIWEVMSSHYFKGHIEFTHAHLPQESHTFTVPEESRPSNSANLLNCYLPNIYCSCASWLIILEQPVLIGDAQVWHEVRRNVISFFTMEDKTQWI